MARPTAERTCYRASTAAYGSFSRPTPAYHLPEIGVSPRRVATGSRSLMPMTDSFRATCGAWSSLIHPEAAVLCCGYRNFWPDGRTQERVLTELGRGLVRDFFDAQQRGLTCVGAIAIRRRALAEFDQPFAVGMRYGEDPDCWFRVAERWPVAYTPRIGVEIRKGVAGRVTDSQDYSVLLPCYERLAERVEQEGFPSHLRRSARVLVASRYLSVATHCAAGGDFARSREMIRSPRAKADRRQWIRAVLRIWAIRLHMKKL